MKEDSLVYRHYTSKHLWASGWQLAIKWFRKIITFIVVWSKHKEPDKFKGQHCRNRELLDSYHYFTKQPLHISELFQAACLAPFPSHIKKSIHPTGNMKTLPNQQVTHKSLCSLAIKADKQPMLIIGFPWLPACRPAVLTATLLFNKLYLPYILPCVWKFFSNPYSDHNILVARMGISLGGISSPTSSSHSLGPFANRWVAVETTKELWPEPHPRVFWRLHSSLGPSNCHPEWVRAPLSSFWLKSRSIDIVWARVRHFKAIKVPADWRLPWKEKGVREQTRLLEHLPPSRQLPCNVRHIMVETKHKAHSPLATASSVGWEGRILTPLFLLLPFPLLWPGLTSNDLITSRSSWELLQFLADHREFPSLFTGALVAQFSMVP